jgi:hypothetical protein
MMRESRRISADLSGPDARDDQRHNAAHQGRSTVELGIGPRNRDDPDKMAVPWPK